MALRFLSDCVREGVPGFGDWACDVVLPKIEPRVEVDLLALRVSPWAGICVSLLKLEFESLLECESPVLKLALDLRRSRKSLRNEGMSAVYPFKVRMVRNVQDPGG